MGELSASPMTVTATGIGSNFQNINPLYRLNGTNYLQWSQVVRSFLKGRGKMGHLTNPSPKEKDLGFKVWDEGDSVIMSWLWNSIKS